MTSLKKEKKSNQRNYFDLEHFKLILCALKTNSKCLKTFHNCFSYFFPFFNDVTKNLFHDIISFVKRNTNHFNTTRKD